MIVPQSASDDKCVPATLFKWVDDAHPAQPRYTPPVVLSDEELFGRLVAMDSTSSCSNLPIVDFICDYLDRPDIALHRQFSADGSKANVIAVMEPDSPAGNGDGIVLCGHLDTVPATESGWESDPFVLTDRGDRWVARGSADMKGFLALAINAFMRADESPLTGQLALLLTYDEEVGCLGARQLAHSWPSGIGLPRSVIIGEPTSLRVVRMNKGHLKLRVTVHGRSAHSGYPHLGVNAIEMAAEAIAILGSLRKTMQSERPENHEFFPEVPFVPLNVGTVRGGTAINIVPDCCEIEVGIRPLPGMIGDDAFSRVQSALRARFDGSQLTVESINESPAMLLEAEAPVHRAMSGLVGQTGSASVSFATDGGWLRTAGFEPILFGPGSIEVAHRPNEFVPKDEFHSAGEILTRAIGHFCRAG